MARKVRDPKLDTKAARLRLERRREPYYSLLSKGRYLGYRRHKTPSGVWNAKFYSLETKEKHYKSLGDADDHEDADGARVLNWAQAQDAARAFFKEVEAKEAGGYVRGGSLTVAWAFEKYFAHREHRGDKPESVAKDRLMVAALILPVFGSVDANKLKRDKLTEFVQSLVNRPAKGRTQDIRARRSSANRVWAIFKAALNLAYRDSDGAIPTDAAWRNVQSFKNVAVARERFLSDDEVARLINACRPDLRELVTGAVLTGCRYGELTRLVVGDFNRDSGTLLVKESKSDRSRHIRLTDQGRAFFEKLILGKLNTALMFTRTDGSVWGRSHQTAPFAEACQVAKVEDASFHSLRHCYASRAIKDGVPLLYVAAQLGHRDIKMVVQHYGHLAPDHLTETIRTRVKPLDIEVGGNVTPLSPRVAGS